MSAKYLRIAAHSALMLWLTASAAAAQVLDLATSLAGYRSSPNACPAAPAQVALESQAVADWALAHVSWSGTVASSLSGSAAQYSTLGAQLFSPQWHGWRLNVASTRDVGDAPCAASATFRQHAAGLAYTWRQSGVTLQYLTRLTRNARGVSGDTLAERVVGPTTRGVSLAAWRHAGRALVTASLGSRSRWHEERRIVQVQNFADTIATDSGPVVVQDGPQFEPRVERSLLHAFGAELRLTWAGGRLAFDALTGHALGGRTFGAARFWGRSDASVALTPSLAIVAGFVLDDGWDNRRMLPRRYFTLGARLTSTPFSRPVTHNAAAPSGVAAAFRVEPGASGASGVVTLGVRAAHARLVEITGDFVQWRAVRMHRASGEWWELRLPIARGLHRVNVRVDGGSWSAPPGLQRQRDEFGGDAGVFVIP